MKRHYPYNSRRFLKSWLLASVAVWPLTAITGAAAGTVVFMMLGFVGPHPYDPPLSTLGILAIAGPIAGFAVGYLQRRILQDQFNWAAAHWLRLSIAGGLVGGVIVGFLGDYSTSSFSLDYLSYPRSGIYGWAYLLMPIFALCLSAAQWVDLRHWVDGAWLWVLANGVGGLVWSMIFLPNTDLALGIIAVLAQGAITGGAMLWLFQMAPHEVFSGPIAYYEMPDGSLIPVDPDEPHLTS